MSDYLALFKEAGYDVCCKEAVVDEEARESMKNGFVVERSFVITTLMVFALPGSGLR